MVPYPAKLAISENCQQGTLLCLVSQKDITGNALNCLNVAENTSFACFACQKDCTLSDTLQKEHTKDSKNRMQF